MRAVLLAFLVLAPLAALTAGGAAGICNVPGSSCTSTQRCLAASLACEQDAGGACGGSGSGYHSTRFVGGAAMQVTCSGSAQSSRIDLLVLAWEQDSSGSAKTTFFTIGAAGFVWRADGSGCTMAVGATSHTCVGSIGPPAPPVPSGSVLP